MDEVTSSKSRIDVRGSSAFAIEEEINKLPISTRIDDNARICPACLSKLRRKKAIEENLQDVIQYVVKNHSPAVPVLAPLSLLAENCIPKVESITDDFVPLLISSPIKKHVDRSNSLGNM